MPARLFALLSLVLLAGCSSVDPQVYRRQQPALDLARYFAGTLEGHGMVLDRGGEVQRRFVVLIRATWNGEIGTLDEDFTWSDGKRERRVWTLRRSVSDGSFSKCMCRNLRLNRVLLSWKMIFRVLY